MPKKCPNTACAKPDNPDTATLCHRCGTRLPGMFGAGGAGPTPRMYFGPMVFCDPQIPVAQTCGIQGTVENVLTEPSIGRGGTNQLWYGRIRLGIKLVTLAGTVLVLLLTASGWGISVFHAVLTFMVGVVLLVIFYKLTGWLLEIMFFSIISLGAGMKRSGPATLTRILAVRPASGSGTATYEIHLKSTRYADLAMPKIGDFIELEGAVQGTRVLVRNYRLGTRK